MFPAEIIDMKKGLRIYNIRNLSPIETFKSYMALKFKAYIFKSMMIIIFSYVVNNAVQIINMLLIVSLTKKINLYVHLILPNEPGPALELLPPGSLGGPVGVVPHPG